MSTLYHITHSDNLKQNQISNNIGAVFAFSKGTLYSEQVP